MKGAKQKQKTAPFEGQAENNGREERGGSGKDELLILYLKESSRFSFLSPEEEKELGRIVKNGLEEIFGAIMSHPLLSHCFQEELGNLPFDGKKRKDTTKWRMWLAANRLLQNSSLGDYLEERGLGGEIAFLTAKRQEVLQALNRMMEGNLRLVISIARMYYCPGLSLLDLIQEGNLGLERSLVSFDYTRGKLGTYIFRGIRMAVLQAIESKGRAIRLPQHIHCLIRRVLCASRDIRQSLGREPTPEEVAQRAGIPVSVVAALEQMESPAISLFLPHFREDKNPKIGEFIADPRDNAFKKIADGKLALVRELLSEDFLSPKEVKVLREKYGFDNEGEEKTLKEIGDEMGFTREYIRRIRNDALRRLYKHAKRRELQLFIRD
jgi:RNA polymerase sigma factor (sigma-70 family)